MTLPAWFALSCNEHKTTGASWTRTSSGAINELLITKKSMSKFSVPPS
jgi:hypothetical protein